MMQKFTVGLVSETVFLFTLSKIQEKYYSGDKVYQNEPIVQILLTFIIFVFIYEVPTYIFRFKMGWSQAQFMQIVAE